MKTAILTISALICTTTAVSATPPAAATKLKTIAPHHVVVAGRLSVSLHSSAIVTPDGNGFITLGSIADITGGTQAQRDRLNIVEVGRPQIDGFTRQLNQGDVSLHIREAGMDPDHDMSLIGATTVAVVASGEAGQTPVASIASIASGPTPASVGPTSAARQITVHKNSPVTIQIDNDMMTITAVGVALDDGAVGDTIRAHRNGMTNDVNVRVVDSRTVELEL